MNGPRGSATTDTRQALIDAAIRRLMTEGWAALRMRELAETVGIRAPSIYHHFPTKSDLGLALIAYLQERTRERVREIDQRSGSLLDRVLQFTSPDSDDPACAESCPVYNLQAEYAVLPKGMQDAVRNLVENLLTVLTAWITAAQAEGEIDKVCDARMEACLVLSICEHGLQLQRVLDDVAVNDLVQSWYRGLRTRDDGEHDD